MGRRDLNAFWEGPSFNVPAGWATRKIDGSSGQLTDARLTAFCRALQAKVEREAVNVAAQAGGNLLRFLDQELATWLAGQRDSARTSALEAKTDKHLRMVQAMTGGRA